LKECEKSSQGSLENIEKEKKEVGNLLSFHCHFFATQVIGGAKELVVLL